MRRGIKADKDSPVVELMKKSGAIPLCVTNTPEMCFGFESTNLLYGTTKNPYDGRRSAGGSSSGEVKIFKFYKINISYVVKYFSL